MQSAEEVESGELLGLPPDRPGTDFYSLLREVRASDIRNLDSLYGRGKVLFAEGETARGVYILRTGRATVSISSSDGRVVILRIAEAGDVLGLNSVLRSLPYDTTVKTLEPCRTQFIPRRELMELMQGSQQGTLAILTILSREVAELTDRAKLLLLPQRASARLAKLLLQWCNGSPINGSAAARIDKVLTQAEMAEMICSSRETVTRLLTTFSKRQIIRVTSDSILITDRPALETMAMG